MVQPFKVVIFNMFISSVDFIISKLAEVVNNFFGKNICTSAKLLTMGDLKFVKKRTARRESGSERIHKVLEERK